MLQHRERAQPAQAPQGLPRAPLLRDQHAHSRPQGAGTCPLHRNRLPSLPHRAAVSHWATAARHCKATRIKFAARSAMRWGRTKPTMRTVERSLYRRGSPGLRRFSQVVRALREEVPGDRRPRRDEGQAYIATTWGHGPLTTQPGLLPAALPEQPDARPIRIRRNHE